MTLRLPSASLAKITGVRLAAVEECSQESGRRQALHVCATLLGRAASAHLDDDHAGAVGVGEAWLMRVDGDASGAGKGVTPCD